MPAALIILKGSNHELRRLSLSHLMKLDDGSQTELIRAAIVQGIEETTQPEPGSKACKPLLDWIRLAASWQPALLADTLWTLCDHTTKLVRDAAARAVGRIGEPIVVQTLPLLQDPSNERRNWAAPCLAPLDAFRGRGPGLPGRRRDMTTTSAISCSKLSIPPGPRQVDRFRAGRSRCELLARPARSRQRSLPGSTSLRLPPLRYADGSLLEPETDPILLYRQSRVKELRRDVEARPLYALIDRGSGSDFALAVIKQFTASSTDASGRWALALACLLGDDRVVAVLGSLIPKWVDTTRMVMAECGIEALAKLGTDAALATVDALALRYEPKKKRVATAAQTRSTRPLKGRD